MAQGEPCRRDAEIHVFPLHRIWVQQQHVQLQLVTTYNLQQKKYDIYIYDSIHVLYIYICIHSYEPGNSLCPFWDGENVTKSKVASGPPGPMVSMKDRGGPAALGNNTAVFKASVYKNKHLQDMKTWKMIWKRYGKDMEKI